MIKSQVIMVSLVHMSEGTEFIEASRNEGYEFKHIQFLSHDGEVVFCAYLEKVDDDRKHSPPPEPRQNPSHSDGWQPRPTQPPGQTTI